MDACVAATDATKATLTENNSTLLRFGMDLHREVEASCAYTQKARGAELTERMKDGELMVHSRCAIAFWNLQKRLANRCAAAVELGDADDADGGGNSSDGYKVRSAGARHRTTPSIVRIFASHTPTLVTVTSSYRSLGIVFYRT